jgi:transposase-like protein
VVFSEHRNMAAAKAFFESAKMVTGITPDRVTTDGHDSYPWAIRTTLGPGVRHRDGQYLNNDWSKIIAASKAATGRCAGSSAHNRLTGSVEATLSYATSSVPALEPISKSPPTTADSTSFATPQRF